MKQEYTLQELNDTIAVLKNFFDEVELLDPLAKKVMDPATLQPVSDYPSHWEDSQRHGAHTDLRCLEEKRRLTSFRVKGDAARELQYHYVIVEGRELVLSMKAAMIESLAMDELGQLAAARTMEEMNRNVYRDYVTGAYNRQYLDTVYSGMVPQMIGEGRNVCFALVSVDHLSDIHAKYGRAAIDNVMGYVVSLFHQQINMEDRDGIVARMGGSSIVVSCEGHSFEHFVARLEEMYAAARKECLTNIYKRVKFTMSIAAADWNEAPNWSSMAELLDKRMLQARSEGGNRIISK